MDACHMHARIKLAGVHVCSVSMSSRTKMNTPDSVPLLSSVEVKPVALLAPIILGLVYVKLWLPAAQGASPVFCSVCCRPHSQCSCRLSPHACRHVEAFEQQARCAAAGAWPQHTLHIM